MSYIDDLENAWEVFNSVLKQNNKRPLNMNASLESTVTFEKVYDTLEILESEFNNAIELKSQYTANCNLSSIYDGIIYQLQDNQAALTDLMSCDDEWS